MPRDSSGLYTLPPGNPVLDGTVIETTWANPTMADIANQLNNVLTRDGLLGPTDQLKATDGTALLPGYAFAAAGATGLFRTGTYLGFSWNGVEKFRISASGVGVGPLPLFLEDGTEAAPSIAAVSDPNTGIFWNPANAGVLNITSQGTRRAYFSSGGLRLINGTAASPALAFIDDTVTGFYATATAGEFGVSNAGAARWYWSPTGVFSNVVAASLEVTAGVTPYLQTQSGVASNSPTAVTTFGLIRYNTNAGGAGGMFAFARSKGALGVHVPVVLNDVLGDIRWFGSDGVDFATESARIRTVAAETFTPTARGGIFSILTTTIGGTTIGTRFNIDNGSARFLVPVQAPDGTAALPGFAFTSEPDCGWFVSGTNDISFATAGVKRLRIANGKVNIQLNGTTPTAAELDTSEIAFTRSTDTVLRVSMKGSDAVVRSATLTLA